MADEITKYDIDDLKKRLDELKKMLTEINGRFTNMEASIKNLPYEMQEKIGNVMSGVESRIQAAINSIPKQ